MGKYFSDAVDNAIEAIYYTYDRERAAAANSPHKSLRFISFPFLCGFPGFVPDFTV